MIKVSVLGSGKVARHLIAALSTSNAVILTEIYSRKPLDFNVPKQIMWINSVQKLSEADLYIMCVSDSAIAALSKSLQFKDKLVVHTSGSIPLLALDSSNKRGVFYPLQTFSKNRDLDFSTIPICLEAENESDLIILNKVANSISNSVYQIDSDQRKALHVAAVFANNFTNHLYAQAADICAQHDIPFDILKPLISETASKVQMLTPNEAQTGPAVRNDEITIQEHLKFLSDTSQKNIYSVLTKSIQNGKKL